MRIRLAADPNQDNTFYVTGDSGQGYIVHNRRHKLRHRRTWTCNCMDFMERRLHNGDICKHIAFVQIKLLQKRFDRSFHECTDLVPAELHIRG